MHPGAAEVLRSAVLDALQPEPGDAAVDLYGGAGLFADALAERVGPGGRVTLVESDGVAVADARHNLRDRDVVRIERGRVDHVLRRRGLLRRADLVVLDPPRSGAGRAVVDLVARLQPRRIAYVACDPAALARDLRFFAERGYVLTDLRAFDLFPDDSPHRVRGNAGAAADLNATIGSTEIEGTIRSRPWGRAGRDHRGDGACANCAR